MFWYAGIKLNHTCLKVCYPFGLKGEEIPLVARIMALGDVYDALSSARCYKEAWDEEKVLSILKEETGKQFEPELVEIFLEIYDTIKSIQERYSS